MSKKEDTKERARLLYAETNKGRRSITQKSMHAKDMIVVFVTSLSCVSPTITKERPNFKEI